MRSAFEGKHPNDGALAQLGERNTGSVEVSGSIPLGSTKSRSGSIRDHPKSPHIAGFFVYTVSKVVQ